MRGMGIDVCQSYLDVGFDGEKSTVRVGNDAAGVAEVVKLARALGDVRVVVEAMGGPEVLVLKALWGAGIAVSQVNPQRAREFARSMNWLVKTDRVDARMLAEMAVSLRGRFRRYEPKEAWQEELGAYVHRHSQVQADLTRTQRQAKYYTVKGLLSGLNKAIKLMKAELKSLVKAIARLQQPHQSEALDSMKGVGVKLTAALLSSLPELGRVSNKAIASLVGVAPYNHDSGKKTGYRRVAGGRAQLRHLLYMGALSAMRYDPELSVFAKRLTEKGKPGKVVLVAVMRKMLVRLNARRRDELNGTLRSVQAAEPA